MGSRETNITNRIRDLLKSVPCSWYEKMHRTGRSISGVPDIQWTWRGVDHRFEVKAPGEEPTRIQEKRMKQLRRAGARVYVVESAEEVAAILRDLGAL